MKLKMNYTILRPAGNDQLLIEGIVKKENRRAINDAMIQRFPNVEQVSFYEFDKKNNTARLELAGGEFCGNATRSLAYLLLNGKPGKLSLQVSGTKHLLTAGVNKSDTAFAQMPIFAKNQTVKKLRNNLFKVELEGITQLIDTSSVEKKSKVELKNYAKKLLREENLLFSVPAAGVMFVKQTPTEILLQPVVWVRDIETILYESACASGTAAVALWYSKNKSATTTINVKQPSQSYIAAIVRKKDRKFVDLFIDGPVEIIKSKGEISL